MPIDPKDRRPFYSPTEFARLAKISTRAVMEMIHSGKLYAVRLSERVYRIPYAAALGTLYPNEVRRPKIERRVISEAEWREEERQWTAEWGAKGPPRVPRGGRRPRRSR